MNDDYTCNEVDHWKSRALTAEAERDKAKAVIEGYELDYDAVVVRGEKCTRELAVEEASKLKVERDKALAACAVYREYYEAEQAYGNCHSENTWNRLLTAKEQCRNNASGVGWLSPDKAKVLREALEKIASIEPCHRNDYQEWAKQALASTKP